MYLLENGTGAGRRLLNGTNCVCYSTEGEKTRRVAFHHHNHVQVEIIAVTKGTLCMQVDGRSYHLYEGDAVLVNPLCVHSGEWSGGCGVCSYLCVTFDVARWLSWRGSTLFAQKDKLLLQSGTFDERYADPALYAMLVQLSNTFARRDAVGESLFAAEMYTLLAWLFDGHYHEETEGRARYKVEFMKKVAQYLEDNYTQDISTEDIAHAFYMTVPAFCGMFKRNYGMSFLNYLCLYRLTLATEKYTEACTLKELAASVGFSDYCYFSRSFRRYMGQSPAAYFGRRSAV